MPYVYVYEDILEEFDDATIRAEYQRRFQHEKKHGGTIPRGEAIVALNDASDKLRQSGNTHLAYKLEEIREDFIA